ncbi:MAG: hypothetical protein JST48_14380 [Bacteroidetes bacterium]|nr:hypothetical protein [Bacteroidota bacterium]
MKTMNIKSIILVALIATLITSCKQDVITLHPPTTTEPTAPSKGSTDFTKYVALGNSLTAGFQAGALFTEGQNNSFPKILSKQFSLAQGSDLAFNQPDINSVNGYNSSYSDPAHGVILGRMILFAADENPNDALPTPAGYPGVPTPYNSADLPAPYTGNKAALNNFGVPGILLGQALTPLTGGPSTGNPYYNALYARFASNPGTSTIIGDALATLPTFFTFDLGNNDVLGYASTGGDGSIPLTSSADFQTYYGQAIGAIMASSSAKGVVTTIPDVTAIPFFTTVKYNVITLSSDQVTQLMGAAAFGGYNQVMQGLAGALTASPADFGLDAAHAAPIIAQINTRLVNYSVGSNPILINDNTLIDMGPFFDGMLAAQQITSIQRAGLAPYEQIRQANSDDLVPLTAGALLGKLANPNDPTTVYGVAVPMADKYILIKAEVDSIKTATEAFNSAIKGVAAQYNTRVAVADVNAAFNSLVAQGAYVSDGMTIMPSFSPPFGAFSEDGVHPNSRGYAYLANIIIDAINTNPTVFGTGINVPKASLADYAGVGFPFGPNGSLLH